MKKNGFTLIEILAVIAVIALLAILVIPNVLKLVDKSKKNLFLTQAKNIYNEAVQEYALSTEEYEEKNRFYYAGEVGEENRLELSGSKKLYYDIEIYNDNVTKFIVSDANYSININNANIKQKDITLDILKAKNEVGYVALDILPKIYGGIWNGTGVTLSRTDDAIGKIVEYDVLYINSDFDNAEIYKEMTEVTDSYGNKFIKIPKFYISKTMSGNTWTWKISKKKWDSSYYLPACFYDEQNNNELPYILVGKYEASLSNDGTKLESKSGKTPVTTKTVNELRTLAKANGSGYQLIDIHIVDIIQTLFYVEFANINSDTIIRGKYYQSTLDNTGNTDLITDSSGSAANDDSFSMKYRGIENIYGNAEEFIDGININAPNVYVAKDATGYASNLFSNPYNLINYQILVHDENYIIKLGYDSNYPFINLPTELGMVSSSKFGDVYSGPYSTGDISVAFLGGSTGSTREDVGINWWKIISESETSYLSFPSSRLVKTP